MKPPIASLFARLRAVRVERPVPLRMVWLLGLASFLVVFEAVTGILLALFYRPTPEGAEASLRYVITEVPHGAFVRALHSHGSHGLLAVLWLSLAVLVWDRGYRAPHGLLWSQTLALTLCATAEAFTGSVLPWTPQAMLNARLGTGMLSQVPVVGPKLSTVLLGGSSAGELTLVRVLGMHAGALPLLGGFSVGLLLLHGASTARSSPDREAPKDLRTSLALWPHVGLRLVATSTAATLALWLSALVREPPLATSERSPRAPWFLLGFDEGLRVVPGRLLGFSGPAVLSLALLFLLALTWNFPRFDPRASTTGRRVAFVVLALYLGATIRGFLR